jgi:hypothetical protein
MIRSSTTPEVANFMTQQLQLVNLNVHANSMLLVERGTTTLHPDLHYIDLRLHKPMINYIEPVGITTGNMCSFVSLNYIRRYHKGDLHDTQDCMAKHN